MKFQGPICVWEYTMPLQPLAVTVAFWFKGGSRNWWHLALSRRGGVGHYVVLLR